MQKRRLFIIMVLGLVPALGVAQDSLPPGGRECQDTPQPCEDGLVWDELTQTCVEPVSS